MRKFDMHSYDRLQSSIMLFLLTDFLIFQHIIGSKSKYLEIKHAQKH